MKEPVKDGRELTMFLAMKIVMNGPFRTEINTMGSGRAGASGGDQAGGAIEHQMPRSYHNRTADLPGFSLVICFGPRYTRQPLHEAANLQTDRPEEFDRIMDEFHSLLD